MITNTVDISLRFFRETAGQGYRSLVNKEEDGEDIDPVLDVRVPAVQQQSGVNDCGIFAIVFALHAILRDDLETISFDQDKMRHHLLGCFRKKQLTPFPQRKPRNAALNIIHIDRLNSLTIVIMCC